MQHRKAIEDAIKQSAQVFMDDVWPKAAQILNLENARLLPMEGRPDSELASMLDRGPGVDAWIIDNKGHMIPVASRCQQLDYKTFTIRRSVRHRDGSRSKEVEYKKKREAIYGGEGKLYPHYTIQAYFDKNYKSLLRFAVVRTKDLFDYIERHGGPIHGDFVQVAKTHDNTASFLRIEWSSLAMDGVDVKVWTKPKLPTTNQQAHVPSAVGW